MIWYVVTDTLAHYRDKPKWHRIKLVLETFANDLCLVLHFSQVTARRLRELRPWAICHSGSATPFSEYDVLQARSFLACLRNWPGPQIGFCGGHQLLAVAFGGAVDRMRRLRPGETDPAPAYSPGWFKEWGPCMVRVLTPHPLFRGLPSMLEVMQYHADEVKNLPPVLERLASSEVCDVQAFAHRSRPLFGVQFHPEEATDEHPHGRQVLRNFFRFARRVRNG
jgi:GMP synthase-like glutamine amidotransferase